MNLYSINKKLTQKLKISGLFLFYIIFIYYICLKFKRNMDSYKDFKVLKPAIYEHVNFNTLISLNRCLMCVKMKENLYEIIPNTNDAYFLRDFYKKYESIKLTDECYKKLIDRL